MEELLVRLEGFEPPTNGFGSHYSIRLSYRRTDATSRAAAPAERAIIPESAPRSEPEAEDLGSGPEDRPKAAAGDPGRRSVGLACRRLPGC